MDKAFARVFHFCLVWRAPWVWVQSPVKWRVSLASVDMPACIEGGTHLRKQPNSQFSIPECVVSADCVCLQIVVPWRPVVKCIHVSQGLRAEFNCACNVLKFRYNRLCKAIPLFVGSLFCMSVSRNKCSISPHRFNTSIIERVALLSGPVTLIMCVCECVHAAFRSVVVTRQFHGARHA